MSKKRLVNKKLIVGLGLFFCAPGVFAISNIENERVNLPEEGLSGAVKLGASGKSGDEVQQSYEVAGKAFYRADKDIFLALLAAEYGSNHNVKDTDNRFLHGRWTHLLNDRWAVEGFGQWEKNEFKNLTSRVLAGGGGRYTLAYEKNVYSLAVGAGAFHETEKLNLVDHEEENKLWRVNSYYSFNYQINPQVSVVNTTYYQPAIGNWDDYRILFDMGLNVNLSSSLQLKLNYRLTYDSDPAKNPNVDPPINNHNTNTEYKTAISYNF